MIGFAILFASSLVKAWKVLIPKPSEIKINLISLADGGIIGITSSTSL
jgi:hypothetical protein